MRKEMVKICYSDGFGINKTRSVEAEFIGEHRGLSVYIRRAEDIDVYSDKWILFDAITGFKINDGRNKKGTIEEGIVKLMKCPEKKFKAALQKAQDIRRQAEEE